MSRLDISRPSIFEPMAIDRLRAGGGSIKAAFCSASGKKERLVLSPWAMVHLYI